MSRRISGCHFSPPGFSRRVKQEPQKLDALAGYKQILELSWAYILWREIQCVHGGIRMVCLTGTMTMKIAMLIINCEGLYFLLPPQVFQVAMNSVSGSGVYCLLPMEDSALNLVITLLKMLQQPLKITS